MNPITPPSDSLQEMWEQSKTLPGLFSVWNKAFPCPKCKEPGLDFCAPHMKHPMICRGCLTMFDFTPVKGNKTR